MQKGKKQTKVEVEKPEGAQAVAQIFSIARDTEILYPYHLDGDMEMYSEEKLSLRNQLIADESIQKQIAEVFLSHNQIVKLYHWSSFQGLGEVMDEKEYKQKQRLLATILRPDIDKQELQFVVDSDWQHDRLTSEGKYYLTKEKLVEALFELVDVWTVGASKQEYVSFCRLLRKKLQRALKGQK